MPRGPLLSIKKVENIKALLGRAVLIEAVEADEFQKDLKKPVEFRDRYPPSGFVLSIGPEVSEVSVGDFVLLENEGFLSDPFYYKVLVLDLKDFGALFVDLEAEQVLRESVELFKKKKADPELRLKSLDGEQYSLLASDILSIEIEEMRNPFYRTEYINCRVLEDSRGRLFYFLNEDEILCKVEL